VCLSFAIGEEFQNTKKTPRRNICFAIFPYFFLFRIDETDKKKTEVLISKQWQARKKRTTQKGRWFTKVVFS
jgi:hypothetical protein